ncbi:fimbrial protein [Serratia sarumanii]|uniref:fimbrial protein n=1 Tax=Serratia sarumanii TaxID=3020826 RepID=UPI003F801773
MMGQGPWSNMSVGALLLGLLITSSAQAQPNVHLYGALVAEPCIIPPGEENIPLDFGTVIDKYLYINTRTLGQRFNLHLTECDLSLGKTVRVTFLGTENPRLPGLLALDAGSQAMRIAIGLETIEAKSLPINKASSAYKLRAGDNQIALKAYVQGEPQAISTKTIGRGAFTATATFKLDYE